MFRFFIPATLLTVGLPAAVEYFYVRGWIPEMPSFLFESTWIVAFVTSVIFVYLFRIAKPSLFVQFYLLSMAVKLLACFAYSLWMILEDPAGSQGSVLYFLGVYVLFTSLEVACLYRKISRSSRV